MTDQQPSLPRRKLHVWEHPGLHGKPASDLPVLVEWEDHEYDGWRITQQGDLCIFILEERESAGQTVLAEHLVSHVSSGYHFKVEETEYADEPETEPAYMVPPWMDQSLSVPVPDYLTNPGDPEDISTAEAPDAAGQDVISDLATPASDLPLVSPLVSGEGLPQRRDSFLDTGKVFLTVSGPASREDQPALATAGANLISGITPGAHEPLTNRPSQDS